MKTNCESTNVFPSNCNKDHKNVLHEQQDKTRGKTSKKLTDKDGAKKVPIIDIEMKEKLPTRKCCTINQIHEPQT